MEKNKGFTLIELLAVIVLLGIIFTIGVTSIVKIINNAKQDTLETQETLFLEAGTNYFIDKMGSGDIKLDEYETDSITLTELINLGYIKTIKDPITDGNCDGSSTVRVGYGGGRKYVYAKKFSCGAYDSEEDLYNFTLTSYDFITGVRAGIIATYGSELIAMPNVGDKESSVYSAMNPTYVDTLYCPNGSEVETSSIVVAEHLSDGTFGYTPGLICDNYLGYKAWDLLEGYGNFTLDADSNGLADGLAFSATENYVLDSSNHIQSFNATAVTGVIAFGLTATANDEYYASCELKSLSTGANLDMYIIAGTSHKISSNGLGDFEKLSVLGSFSVTGTIYVGFRDYATSSWQTISGKGLYLLDLTTIYGSGNEPVIGTMDTIMTNSGY